MAKKTEPIINKMYEWELDVNGELVKWKCFVGEDECITYEGDQECQRLKIENKEQARGVLQIDCEVKVYDGMVPFQLEKGVPYIKLENDEGKVEWVLSDDSKEERLQSQIRRVKKDAYLGWFVGVLALIGSLIVHFKFNNLEDWMILPVFGIFFISTGAMNMLRLKRELEAMGRPFSWKLKD